MLKKKTNRLLINILLIITIIFLLTKLSNIISPVIEIVGDMIVPIIIGGFFYYALRPIARYLKDKTKKRGLSAILTILIVVSIISVVLFYGGNVVVDQFKEAFVDNQDKFVEYGDYLNGKFEEYFPNFDIVPKVVETLKSLSLIHI